VGGRPGGHVNLGKLILQHDGVIYVGGLSPYGIDAKLYRLRHAGIGAQWELLANQLLVPRIWHTAFLVPDEIANCTSI